MIGNAKADSILINASSFLNSIIFHYIKQAVLNEELNNLTDHGKQVCLAGGVRTYDCSNVKSLGEGICLAGGVRTYDCSNVKSLGEGICLAGGVRTYDCSNVKSLGEGIQLADNSGVDLKWAWDAFKDQNGYVAWVCRGANTRRFAEQSQCGQSEKADRIWPSP